MPKVHTFSTEITANIHIMNLPKLCKLDEGIVLIIVSEIIGHYFPRMQNTPREWLGSCGEHAEATRGPIFEDYAQPKYMLYHEKGHLLNELCSTLCERETGSFPYQNNWKECRSNRCRSLPCTWSRGTVGHLRRRWSCTPVTSENHWQIASRVTQKSLFTVTNILFHFSHAILCHEHTILLKTIIDRSFRNCRQGRSFLI